MESLIQIDGERWVMAFSKFVKEHNLGKSYHVGSTYPSDEWEGDLWYEDQLLFDTTCGIKRCWLNDYLGKGKNFFGYDIVDRERFLLAKIKYCF